MASANTFTGNIQWRRKRSGRSGHGRYTFSAQKPSSPDPGRPGDEASRIHATRYAPIRITHAHARVFLEITHAHARVFLEVLVARQQLSLTRSQK